jgi:hypothetical protein
MKDYRVNLEAGKFYHIFNHIRKHSINLMENEDHYLSHGLKGA